MSKQMYIPDSIYERAEELKDERDFASLGEAVRYMCREGNFDV